MYPILLDIRNRLVVVVGGGRVAARKVAELHRAGAEIIVISPDLHPDIEALRGKIEIRQTVYEEGMLLDLIHWDFEIFMVFAATDSHKVNALVFKEAKEALILVNSVDDGARSDFSNMATVRRGDITIAVATGGASPALAAHLREQVESVVGEEYATLTKWMGENRARVKRNVDAEARRNLWRSIIDSPVLQYLRDGDEQAARQFFDRMIEEATHE
jgi:precorrin-2 dehydrogenase / sirohydrochlorin ferrochelatase